MGQERFSRVHVGNPTYPKIDIAAVGQPSRQQRHQHKSETAHAPIDCAHINTDNITWKSSQFCVWGTGDGDLGVPRATSEGRFRDSLRRVARVGVPLAEDIGGWEEGETYG